MLKVYVNILSIIRKADSGEILRNINFHLEEGNAYTIIGKNGEGKTTLLNVIARLYDLNQLNVKGEILFNGVDLLKLPLKQLQELRKSKIQCVFQDPVNSFDHLKRIGYYFQNDLFSAEAIKEAFEYFRLPAAETVLKLYPYELSGGMAQRICFILAVLKNPEFLILDEPTSGIDLDTVLLMKEYLKLFTKEKNGIVLTITQDLSFANGLTDMISFLSDSELTPFSAYNEFLENPPGEKAALFINAYKKLQNG